MLLLTECDENQNERIYFLTENSLFYHQITYSKASEKGNFKLSKKKEEIGIETKEGANLVDVMS